MQGIALILLLSIVDVVDAAPDPDVVTAQLKQQWLPDYDRRTTIAVERITSADRYFAGEAELGACWPELSGAPLLSPAFVQGQLLLLSEREEQRSTERLSVTPEGLGDRDARRWRAALDEALQAEDEADQRTRRLFTALSAGLKRAPLLRTKALDALVQTWRAEVGELPAPADPKYAEAARLAAEVGELEVILTRYQGAAIRAMTIPGDLSLVRLASADLSRQGSVARTPRQTSAAADRLRRVMPLLAEDMSSSVQETLDVLEIARLEERIAALEASVLEATVQLRLVQAPEGVDRETLAAQDEAAQRALETIQDETLDVLMAEPTAAPVPSRRRRVAELRLELAEMKASLASERLRLVPPEVVRSAEEGAIKTAAQLDDAQRKVEEATRKAEAASKEAQALVARLQQTSDEIATAEAARQAQVAEQLDALQVGREEVDAFIERAQSAMPGEKAALYERAYGNQLDWLQTLRSALQDRQREIARLRGVNFKIRNSLPSMSQLTIAAGTNAELIRSVEETVNAIEVALVGRMEQAHREQDEIARMLEAAREEQRWLRAGLAESVRVSVEQQKGVDPVLGIADEVGDIQFIYAEKLRSLQTTEVWSLRDITRQILAFLNGSLEVVLVFIIWSLIRRNGAVWVEQYLRFFQRMIPQNRNRSAQQQFFDQWLSADLTGLSARLTPVVQPGATVLVAWLVFAFIHRSVPLLGFLALVWMAVAALRLVRPVVELLVVDSDTIPFALIRTDADTRRLYLRTGRLLTAWWMAAMLARFFTYRLLGADLLTDRVEDLFTLLLIGIIIISLLRWSATVRGLVKSRASDPSRLVRWMIDEPDTWIGRLLRSGAGVLFLASDMVSRLFSVLIEGRGGMGWIGSLIAQHSLKEVNQTCPPLGPLERRRLRDEHASVFLHMSELDAVHTAYEAWRTEQRRGMVAVIGERGAGKSLVLDRLANLGGEIHPVRRICPPRRILEAPVALRWLGEALELPAESMKSVATLRRALLQMPPTIILVDDTQLLLLRAVRGFTAIREVLDMMHLTSERHFWVTAFHGPAWAFLEGTAVQINLDVFRAAVRLAPLDPGRMSGWLSGMTRGIGLDFRFNNLAPNAPLTADLARELIRIESAFWRRLADISQGNPQVAVAYWLDSLRHSADLRSARSEGRDPEDIQTSPGVLVKGEVLEIALIDPPDPTDVEALPDIDLFVLTAIMLHDGLNVSMLARSLNAPPTQMRASCRHLEGMGVLEKVSDIYRIRISWRTAVARLLRQKHFLHRR
ncbi:MAG: AAA family ATPase [Myxococcota bacterium]